MLVTFCQFVLKILSGNEIQSRAITPSKFCEKMMGNNLKLDHMIVNVDVHIKFGQILSICSRDIERKRNSDVNQGP